jgi:hypothetical protein
VQPWGPTPWNVDGSGLFNGALVRKRSTRSGFAMQGTPKATRSALPASGTAFALALSKPALTMSGTEVIGRKISATCVPSSVSPWKAQGFDGNTRRHVWISCWQWHQAMAAHRGRSHTFMLDREARLQKRFFSTGGIADCDAHGRRA